MDNDPWSQFGGPAFPAHTGGTQYKGMTLRDYFAAHLAHGQIGSGQDLKPISWQVIAENAYGIADAMLKEREK